jgi:hypothetical protein
MGGLECEKKFIDFVQLFQSIYENTQKNIHADMPQAKKAYFNRKIFQQYTRIN